MHELSVEVVQMQQTIMQWAMHSSAGSRFPSLSSLSYMLGKYISEFNSP
jgi:hypothetical protein